MRQHHKQSVNICGSRASQPHSGSCTNSSSSDVAGHTSSALCGPALSCLQAMHNLWSKPTADTHCSLLSTGTPEYPPMQAKQSYAQAMIPVHAFDLLHVHTPPCACRYASPQSLILTADDAMFVSVIASKLIVKQRRFCFGYCCVRLAVSSCQ